MMCNLLYCEPCANRALIRYRRYGNSRCRLTDLDQGIVRTTRVQMNERPCDSPCKGGAMKRRPADNALEEIETTCVERKRHDNGRDGVFERPPRSSNVLPDRMIVQRMVDEEMSLANGLLGLQGYDSDTGDCG